MARKEAIEKLEKARDRINPGRYIHTTRVITAFEEINQALAILKEQPPAGKFTKEIRTAIQRYRIGQVDIAPDWAIDKLTEALIYLDRLDTETQRPDKAEAENKEYQIACQDISEMMNITKESIFKELEKNRILKVKLKAKDELLFAYESVRAPVNPLLSINKELLEACEAVWDDTKGLSPSDYVKRETFEKIKAAIAKAKQ